MVIDRCVFVYATQRLQTFKWNISQPLHQACIIIAAGTYFEQGGLWNKTGGGGGGVLVGHVTRVMRDTMIQKHNFC